VGLRVRGAVQDRRPGDQPGGHAAGRVAAARERARAGHRGGAGRAGCEGPRIRAHTPRQRVAR
jgi:hypothetical protein